MYENIQEILRIFMCLFRVICLGDFCPLISDPITGHGFRENHSGRWQRLA